MKRLRVERPDLRKEIPIGVQGENGARQIAFDISYWINKYGAGTASLLHRRSQDAEAYPVVLTQDEALAIWTVSNVDTQYAGSGLAELSYTVGENIVKSAKYVTLVAESIGAATGEAPDAYETWLETLAELAAQTQQNAADAAQSAAEITGMTAQAETLPAGSEATASYSDGVLTLGIPRGADGGGSGSSYTFTDPDGDGNIIISEVV